MYALVTTAQHCSPLSRQRGCCKLHCTGITHCILKSTFKVHHFCYQLFFRYFSLGVSVKLGWLLHIVSGTFSSQIVK